MVVAATLAIVAIPLLTMETVVVPAAALAAALEIAPTAGLVVAQAATLAAVLEAVALSRNSTGLTSRDTTRTCTRPERSA